jgi:3-methyl-2-oxobutanoate hydroxymethyltransferase
MDRKKVTVRTLQARKEAGERITMLTAYDWPTAGFIDAAGIDIILVGDSVGNTMLGYPNTLPVTMDEMIHHAKAVRRGCQYVFLVGDMPFLSYQASVAEGVRNAGRFLKEAGCDAIKLEGGTEMLPVIRAIIDAGIPVMGHLGLTPQSVQKFGGYVVQGKTAESAAAIVASARALEVAGCCTVLLEAVPHQLGTYITRCLRVPVVGIGAGPGTDGQVLVTPDLLGTFETFKPKFAKRYLNLAELTRQALTQYREEVIAGTFPAAEHCFEMPAEEFERLKASEQGAGNRG